jgi:hypothetical protein
MTLLLV